MNPCADETNDSSAENIDEGAHDPLDGSGDAPQNGNEGDDNVTVGAETRLDMDLNETSKDKPSSSNEKASPSHHGDLEGRSTKQNQATKQKVSTASKRQDSALNDQVRDLLDDGEQIPRSVLSFNQSMKRLDKEKRLLSRKQGIRVESRAPQRHSQDSPERTASSAEWELKLQNILLERK